MTNFNRIQLMTKDTFADFLMEFRRMCERQDDRVCIKGIICKEKIEYWLSQEDVEEPKEWEQKPIAELGLKPKIYESLFTAGIVTIGDLVRMRVYDLAKIPHIGETGIQEIKEIIEDRYGFKISP